MQAAALSGDAQGKSDQDSGRLHVLLLLLIFQRHSKGSIRALHNQNTLLVFAESFSGDGYYFFNFGSYLSLFTHPSFKCNTESY